MEPLQVKSALLSVVRLETLEVLQILVLWAACLAVVVTLYRQLWLLADLTTQSIVLLWTQLLHALLAAAKYHCRFFNIQALLPWHRAWQAPATRPR